jgi:hypothetical protein
LKAQPVSLVERREGVPKDLDHLILKALAKHPTDRFASAADMREGLQKIRARMRQLPTSDRCAACGASVAPTFRFCPECGAPRKRVSKTFEIARPPVDVSTVLPLAFTGRSEELKTLVAHMRKPPGPNLGLLVVGAEGTGRSTLLRAAYERLAQTGRVIYQVGPDPSGLTAPFYPMRSLLAAMLSLPPVSSETELKEAVLRIGLNERDVPGIAQLFGHPTTLLELEPAVRRREVVWSTLRALERIASRLRMAVVCEDIERFDSPSLEILRRATESVDVALPPIVMTATPAFAEKWPRAITRLELGAFATKDVEQLATTLSAGGLATLPRTSTLYDTTRGMPGHVEHVVRYLVEGGKVEDIKVSLPDLVAARRSMLAQGTRDVLQAAAVLGSEPSIGLLRSMLPGGELEPALADAASHGILTHDPSGELVFASRLVRDIVYDATPADVRRSLHAKAATAVQTLSPDIGLLGHHHDLAGHAKDAINLLRNAGDHAAEQLDDAGAGQFYYRALVCVRQAVQSGDLDASAELEFVQLSVKLADVLRARGETALARGILAEARDWSSAPLLVSMIDRASAAIGISEGDLDGAIASLRRGVGRAIGSGDMNLVCELYLDLAAALLRSGDADTALRELIECVDLATLGEGFTATEGPEPFWRVLRAQAQMVDTAGDSYRALRLAEAALFHAQRVRSRLGAARVQQLLAALCEQAGLGGKAERYRQAAIHEMRNLGDRRATAELLLSDTPPRGAVVVQHNRMQDAMQLTKEIGWTEGHERAKRKSTPPTDAKD